MPSQNRAPTPSRPPPEVEPPGRPQVHFDWQDWLPYVATCDGTDAQKRALIEAVWAIVLTFVDHGWEVGTKPGAGKKTCGQDIDLTTALMAAVVDSEKSKTEKEDA